MPASAPWTPPSRRSLAEEAGRDHGCRQANEAVLPFSVLHEAVIVAAVWAIARWRAPILGKFASPGSCSA